MDKHVMSSGLAELEQLHMEHNSEHVTSLHCSPTHCRGWKAGQGLETRLEYERVGLQS